MENENGCAGKNQHSKGETIGGEGINCQGICIWEHTRMMGEKVTKGWGKKRQRREENYGKADLRGGGGVGQKESGPSAKNSNSYQSEEEGSSSINTYTEE